MRELRFGKLLKLRVENNIVTIIKENQETMKKVIIRADRAGVFYGTLVKKEGNEVELADCRRLWYWDGACSISELAVSGVKKPLNCKFSVSVPSITILGVIEVIPCSDDASKNIEVVPVWKA